MVVTVEDFLANDENCNLDFEREAERLGFGLGCKAGPAYNFGRSYEDEVPPKSDAELRLAIEQRDAAGVDALNASLVIWIYNQLQEGSCVGNGTAQAGNIKQAQQFGKDKVVLLSPISIYKQIGRSAQSGATIDDAAREFAEIGGLPLDTPANRAEFGDKVMPATGFSTRYPDNWKETAKLLIATDVLPIRTFQGIKTAGVAGDPIVVGRQGHCVCYTDLLWNASKGKFEYPYVNSWGKWGSPFAYMEYGFGRDSESYIKESAYFAFAVRRMAVRIVNPAA